MIVNIRKNISRNLINVPGWKTKRKILVIESDDWGTIRMASKKAYNYFIAKGLPVDKCPYNSFDALESNDDLSALFNVLESVKDKSGNAAIITANNIVANPDFEKIAAAGFSKYFYEPFTKTLKRYPSHDNVETLYRQGIQQNIFRPQFHGREHINIPRWLHALQSGSKAQALAFRQSMFTIHEEIKPAVVNEYLDAFDADSEKELEGQAAIIEDGLRLFKKLWGYQPASFIAPCYIWSSKIEPVLSKNGIRYIQGLVNQLAPVTKPGYRYKKIYHYLGQKNTSGQYYLLRNVFFEPSTNPSFDWQGDAMKRIAAAFRWGKPAVISSHRLNFIGFIHEKNRTENLALLKGLLKEITRRWPEVEFMASDQLGDLISKRKLL